jgi:hypothetical protein
MLGCMDLHMSKFSVSLMEQAFVAAVMAVAGCSSDDPKAPCPEMFGQPNETTGLDESSCTPECPCTGLQPHRLEQADSSLLASTVLLNPPELLSADPYAEPVPPAADPESVCGVEADPQTPGAYRTETFIGAEAAAAQGAVVTHTGPCGMCSSLQDLSVYLGHGDLTSPVRICAAKALSGGKEVVLECLRELGFSEPCALIWYYNSGNTRAFCLVECLEALDQPYHLADGSLNPCLQCDEDHSGPVFKAVAGRTRRNSGLASAICRPCATVSSVEHDYGTILDGL